MIELEQLMLVIVGIIIGSVLGTEYASWRMMRKVKGMFFDVIGVDPVRWKLMPRDAKLELIGQRIQHFGKAMFPESTLVAPSPSKIVSLSGNEFFVPQCPKCGRAAFPVKNTPGATVRVICPKHGDYHVQIPETEKEKEE